MTAKGHVLLATPIIAGTMLVTGLKNDSAILFLAAGFLGSLLPDIDEPNSFIGQRTLFFSHFLSLFVKHRGITHFAIFPMLLMLFSAIFSSGLVQIALFGVSVGWLAHLVGDLLTKGGIRGFFYPFYRHKTIGLLPRFLRFYTGSIREYLLMLPLAAINVWIFYWIIQNRALS